MPLSDWPLSNVTTPPAVESHLEVDDGEVVAVGPADDGVQVLELRGQEGSEGSLQAHSAGLLEAQEVGSTNPSHVASLRGIQGDDMKLRRKTQGSGKTAASG